MIYRFRGDFAHLSRALVSPILFNVGGICSRASNESSFPFTVWQKGPPGQVPAQESVSFLNSIIKRGECDE